eukprot:681548-Prymnesium_polylepis.1
MPTRLIKDPERYKTVECAKGWNNEARCPYKHKCQFAHYPEELRCRPVRVKYQAPMSLLPPPPPPVFVPQEPPPPPPPPPSAVQSPVTVITQTIFNQPAAFHLVSPVVIYTLPPDLPEVEQSDNETLDYLSS